MLKFDRCMKSYSKATNELLVKLTERYYILYLSENVFLMNLIIPDEKFHGNVYIRVE